MRLLLQLLLLFKVFAPEASLSSSYREAVPVYSLAGVLMEKLEATREPVLPANSLTQ